MNRFDVFFSYAAEDEEFAKELVGALKFKGLRVWYAPIDLIVGDKLLDSIEKGVNNSSSGILLISNYYLKKAWTNFEMDILLRQNIETEKKIFPIWHNVEKHDVEKRHFGLSGITAIKSNIGFPTLVTKLTEALSSFAPTIGVIPSYESPKFRFLQGRGEITLSKNGFATTLWEFLLHSKASEYPLYIEGDLYDKDALLQIAAGLLPHIPEQVKNCVNEDGYNRIFDMCKRSGFNPGIY